MKIAKAQRKIETWIFYRSSYFWVISEVRGDEYRKGVVFFRPRPYIVYSEMTLETFSTIFNLFFRSDPRTSLPLLYIFMYEAICTKKGSFFVQNHWYIPKWPLKLSLQLWFFSFWYLRKYFFWFCHFSKNG